MTCYSIEFKRSAKKALLNLPKPVAQNVSRLIDELSENPYPVGHKKLVGSEHAYRIKRVSTLSTDFFRFIGWALR